MFWSLVLEGFIDNGKGENHSDQVLTSSEHDAMTVSNIISSDVTNFLGVFLDHTLTFKCEIDWPIKELINGYYSLTYYLIILFPLSIDTFSGDSACTTLLRISFVNESYQ